MQLMLSFYSLNQFFEKKYYYMSYRGWSAPKLSWITMPCLSPCFTMISWFSYGCMVYQDTVFLAHLHQLSHQHYSTTKCSNNIVAYAKNSPYHTGQEYAIHELFLKETQKLALRHCASKCPNASRVMETRMLHNSMTNDAIDLKLSPKPDHMH